MNASFSPEDLDRVRAGVARDRDRRLGEAAVARGWITAAQLGESLRELVTREQFEELVRERRGGDAAFFAGGVPALPPEAAPFDRDPARNFHNYLLVEEIGQGGMGRVWKAWDRALQRWVALKVLHDGTPEAARPRFLREARAAARVKHPHLVTVFDAGEHDRKPFLVMELVQGRPLQVRGAQRETVQVLRKVALALDEAHRNGVIHRDLKPGNILVDDRGEPHVVDFGLAHLADSDLKLTRSGTAIGTPLYMAPEQVAGTPGAIGPRTDVYALGVILYEVLMGRTPHGGESASAVYARILSDDPIPPEGPRDLVTICQKALEKEPDRRYATAGALAEDLRRWLEGEPIAAHPPSLLYRMRKRMRRHAGTGAAAVATIAIIIGGILVARRAAESSRQRELLVRIQPISEKVQSIRSLFYVENVDMRAKLDEVERAMADLEVIAADRANAGLPELWSTLGSGWYAAGDDAKAERALLRARELRPDDGRILFHLARIYIERSILALMASTREAKEAQRPDAAAWAEKARDCLARPTATWTGAAEVDRLASRAWRAYIERRGPEAEALCREGLARFAREPGSEEFPAILGLDTAGEDRIAWFDKAIARRPHYPWGLFIRGTARMTVKDYDRAVADFDRAIALHPRFPSSWLNRGNAKRARGDIEGAIADYDGALRLRPAYARALINRGGAKLGAGDLAGAVADYGEAIRQEPGLPNAWYGRALARGRSGDEASALADLRKAIEVAAPDWPDRDAVLRMIQELERPH